MDTCQDNLIKKDSPSYLEKVSESKQHLFILQGLCCDDLHILWEACIPQCCEVAVDFGVPVAFWNWAKCN